MIFLLETEFKFSDTINYFKLQMNTSRFIMVMVYE